MSGESEHRRIAVNVFEHGDSAWSATGLTGQESGLSVDRSWRTRKSRELDKLVSTGSGGRARLAEKKQEMVLLPEDTKDDEDSIFCNMDEDSIASDLSEDMAAMMFPSPKLVDDSSNGEHIILPYSSFEKFLSCYACRKCQEPVKSLCKQSIGVATMITHNCECGITNIIEPERVIPKPGEKVDGHWLRRASSCALNCRMVLAAHLLGGGFDAGLIVGSLLSLTSSLFSKAWHPLEEKLGLTIRNVTREIVSENIEEECLGVPKDDNGYTPIDVSGDGGWQSGGRSYNSLSGHTMLVGKKSNKVVAFETYSKGCIKCDNAAKRGEDVDPHACPRNYVGSSKGMESAGLLKCVVDLHNDSNIVIRKFVIDDDTTTKAYMRHSYKALEDAGLASKEDWPRTEKGHKKKDYGKLPLSHPRIFFVSDRNHRIRTFGGSMWKQRAAGKSETELSVVDCHRVKRNFAYCLHRYCHATREEFKKRIPAVLLHHFNVHTHCDSTWCVYVAKGPEAAAATGKYRNMEVHAKLYAQLKIILDKYTTDECLDEMHHPFSSQKNEALNRSVMRFAPKTRCFGKTSSLSTRVGLAVSINSVGHRRFYERAFPQMGLRLSGHTSALFDMLDRRFFQNKQLRSSARVKRRRCAVKSAKWRAQALLERFDAAEGRTYKSGIGIQGEECVEVEPTPKKARLSLVQCKCGSYEHCRTSHSSCIYNKKNILAAANKLKLDDSNSSSCFGRLDSSKITTDGDVDGSTNGSQIEDSMVWDNLELCE